jgi:hypothetical protein
MKQRVVSLGGNCMVTKEMRTFFGISAANMFDWWITPGGALVRLIAGDFTELFSREDLAMVGDRKSVANLRYGILHHHDFPRNDEEDRVVEITDERLQRNREKFAYLHRRWDEIGKTRGPVLFVRYGWLMGEPMLEGIPAGGVDPGPAGLMEALDRKFPKLEYRILLIDAPEVELRHPKVLYRDSRIFTQPGERLKSMDLTWKDNTAIFSRIFSTVRME